MNERFDDDEEEEVENDVKKQQRLFHGRSSEDCKWCFCGVDKVVFSSLIVFVVVLVVGNDVHRVVVLLNSSNTFNDNALMRVRC